jgi:hypothetical protein
MKGMTDLVDTRPRGQGMEFEVRGCVIIPGTGRQLVIFSVFVRARQRFLFLQR